MVSLRVLKPAVFESTSFLTMDGFPMIVRIPMFRTASILFHEELLTKGIHASPAYIIIGRQNGRF